MVVDPAPQIQLSTLPRFAPSEGLVRTLSTERLVQSHDDSPALRRTRLFDSSFDSAAGGPVSGCSSKSSRLIDLSFFSSCSFSEQDASPMARSLRQKIVHSPLSVVSSHSERSGCLEDVSNISNRGGGVPVVPDSIVAGTDVMHQLFYK